MSRTKLRFLYQSGGNYYWQATLPVDSRYVTYTCPVNWFWGRES